MSETKLKVKGILFDLDGTILDTKEAYVEAAKIAFKATGQDPPETAKLLELPKRIEQKKPITDIVKADPKAFLDVYLKTFYAIAGSKTKPVLCVKEALEVLSEKAKLAVITMRFMPKDLVLAELHQYGLAKYFTHVVTALDTDKPKPSPEALIKAVRAMDVQMCDCVIVGDSVVDVQAGKSAGAKTVAVLTGLYSRAELSAANPDLIIADVSELPKFIA
jgi:phosphoglycolate phosphatase-like HAD superfamily hydrolase